jgi:hypothetical protein
MVERRLLFEHLGTGADCTFPVCLIEKLGAGLFFVAIRWPSG